MKHIVYSTVIFASLAACSDDKKSDTEFRAEVVASMHDSIGEDLSKLVQAAKDLQTAAPTHAWSATADASAITMMREAWKRTRVAYEHVEGATAPIFGGLDGTMDARYDDYMLELRPDGDPDPFDGTGVTGMHGIERILYSHDIRPEVDEFESMLDGYEPARYPSTDAEAMAFKTKLVQKLIDDAQSLHDQWQPAAIDLGFAFQGLVGLMNEQGEKVDLAATGEEESRYANLTMFDLRNNLAGTKQIYEVFREWIKSKPEGVDPDIQVQARFAALTTLYASIPGEAIPTVPDGWSGDAPTPAQLDTSFGKLWKAVHDDVDPDAAGSVVFEMHAIASMLGFPELPE